jgi:hypothetical protein
LQNAVGKLTTANAVIDRLVGLIGHTDRVIVVFVFRELLPKFGQTGFARFGSLRDPLVTSDRLRLSKQRRPKTVRMLLSPPVLKLNIDGRTTAIVARTLA